MQFLAKVRKTLTAFVDLAHLNSKRLQRSNEKTISYVKNLKSAADGELRRIVTEESAAFVRNTAKLRAARFLLGNRG